MAAAGAAPFSVNASQLRQQLAMLVEETRAMDRRVSAVSPAAAPGDGTRGGGDDDEDSGALGRGGASPAARGGSAPRSLASAGVGSGDWMGRGGAAEERRVGEDRRAMSPTRSRGPLSPAPDRTPVAGAGAAAGLPLSLEECHRLILLQDSALQQLERRVAEAERASRASSDAFGELGILDGLRQTVARQAAEIEGLKKERTELLDRLLEQSRRARETAQGFEEVQSLISSSSSRTARLEKTLGFTSEDEHKPVSYFSPSTVPLRGGAAASRPETSGAARDSDRATSSSSSSSSTSSSSAAAAGESNGSSSSNVGVTVKASEWSPSRRGASTSAKSSTTSGPSFAPAFARPAPTYSRPAPSFRTAPPPPPPAYGAGSSYGAGGYGAGGYGAGGYGAGASGYGAGYGSGFGTGGRYGSSASFAAAPPPPPPVTSVYTPAPAPASTLTSAPSRYGSMRAPSAARGYASAAAAASVPESAGMDGADPYATSAAAASSSSAYADSGGAAGAGGGGGGDGTAEGASLSSRPFFGSLLEGMPVLKHRKWPMPPHKKVLWLDVSDAMSPGLMWNDPPSRDPMRAKRLGLFDIQSLNSGICSDRLRRTGKLAKAAQYMSFAKKDNETLDLEFASREDRDWFFTRCNQLFQAFADAYKAGLKGPSVVERARQLMNAHDAGVAPAPATAGRAARRR